MRLRSVGYTAVGLSAVLFLAGCSATAGQERLFSVTPRGGKPASPELFETAEKIAESGDPRADRAFLSPLPTVSRKRNVSVYLDEDKAINSDYSMIALGIPYQYIPFQFSFSRYVYTRDNPEPVGKLERRYSPFWSYSKTTGDVGDDFEIDVKGVPLLAEWGYERGPSWYFEDLYWTYDPEDQREFRFFAALWWLGPTYYDIVGSYRDEEGVMVDYEGEYFTPLLLGRALGFLLWTNYRSSMTREGRTEKATGYGPLLGYPTYISTKTVEADGSSKRTRLLLGGALWYEGASEEPGGVQRNSATGPLWGLFGGGRRNDAPVVYILRVPIKVGSAPSE